MAVTLKSNALITEAELETFLVKSLESDYANTLINAASDYIERYCNRKFIAADYTDEVYNGNGEYRLYLKNCPINSVSAVKMWDTYNNVVLYTYAANTEYLYDSEEGYIHLRSRWTCGTLNFRITYNAGYAIADVPYDLKQACADYASWLISKKGKTGMASERIGSYSYSIAPGGGASIGGLSILSEILSVLMAYRTINI